MAGPRGHLTGRGLQRYNTSVDRRRRPPASLDGRAHFVSGKRNLTKTLLAHMPEMYFRSKGRTAVLRLTAVGEEAWDERNPMGLPRQASWRRGDASEEIAKKRNTLCYVVTQSDTWESNRLGEFDLETAWVSQWRC